LSIAETLLLRAVEKFNPRPPPGWQRKDPTVPLGLSSCVAAHRTPNLYGRASASFLASEDAKGALVRGLQRRFLSNGLLAKVPADYSFDLGADGNVVKFIRTGF
jgi:hypothetical protein